MDEDGPPAGGEGHAGPRHRADGIDLAAPTPGLPTTFSGAGQGVFAGLLAAVLSHWLWGANLVLIPLAYGFGMSRLRSWPELAGILTMLGTTVAYFAVYDVVAIDGLGPWRTIALVGLVVLAFFAYVAVVGNRVEASRVRALARAGSHPELVEQSQQWEDRYHEELRGPAGPDPRRARRWFRLWLLRTAAACAVWLWLMWGWESRALPSVVLSVLVLHLLVFHRMVRYHQRLTQEGAGLVVGRSTRRPVLFLRPFALDGVPVSPMESRWSVLKVFSWFDKRSFEEYLHDSFSELGPMVAIGRPGEQLAVLGAAREYADDESWRDLVLTRAQEARLVVMELDASPGMRWELDHVPPVVGLERLVVVLPPEVDDLWSRSPAWYERWQELREANAFLPEVSGDSAAVVFDDDGEAVVIRERSTLAATLDEVRDTWLRLRKDEPGTASWKTSGADSGSDVVAATAGVWSVPDEHARRRVRTELVRREAVLRGLATRRTLRHGRDDAEALRHRHALANVYVAQGRVERAQALLEDVVARRARIEGPDGVLTLAALADLAGTQRLRGDLSGFLETVRSVADGTARTLGDEAPETFAARMQLGLALHEAGQLAAAAGLLRELLDAPAAHVVAPDVRRRAQRVLGSVLTTSGDYGAAAELLRAALEEAVSTVGADHDTCEARGMLAEAVAGLGEPGEAASLAREALAGAEVLHGPTHPLTLKYLVNASRHTADAGEPEMARDLAERAVTVTRETLGPDHPDTLTALSVLGRARHLAGESVPAVDLFLLAWKGRTEVLGPHHPHTLAVLASAADAQYAAGRTEAALVNLRTAVDGYVASLGPDHPHTRAARAALALWERSLDEP